MKLRFLLIFACAIVLAIGCNSKPAAVPVTVLDPKTGESHVENLPAELAAVYAPADGGRALVERAISHKWPHKWEPIEFWPVRAVRIAETDAEPYPFARMRYRIEWPDGEKEEIDNTFEVWSDHIASAGPVFDRQWLSNTFPDEEGQR